MEEEGMFFNIMIWLFLIEIGVGAIQLIGALIRTIIKLNSEKSVGKLKTYWVISGIYIAILMILFLVNSYVFERVYENSKIKHEELSGESYYDNNTVNLIYMKWLNYSYYSIEIWTPLAWLIAIWYWKNIVFTKATISTITKLFKK